MLKQSLSFILYFCSLKTSIQTQLYTPMLISQRNEEINWANCKYLVVCKNGPYESCKEWAHHIIEKKLKNICAILSIPKWYTKAIGSKYLIKKSIYILETRIPIFIDWEEEFAKSNNINIYPTIVLLKNENHITELGRVSGKYTNNKLALL